MSNKGVNYNKFKLNIIKIAYLNYIKIYIDFNNFSYNLKIVY